MANDLNPDNLSLTVEITANPTHGQASVNCDQVLYTPTANYFGPDSFTYALKDGAETLDTAVVDITVLNLNDPPSAVEDARDDIDWERGTGGEGQACKRKSCKC